MPDITHVHGDKVGDAVHKRLCRSHTAPCLVCHLHWHGLHQVIRRHRRTCSSHDNIIAKPRPRCLRLLVQLKVLNKHLSRRKHEHEAYTQAAPAFRECLPSVVPSVEQWTRLRSGNERDDTCRIN